MLNEVLEWLVVKPGNYLDGTLGAGGHSGKILEKCTHFSEKSFLVGVDRDENIIEIARQNLKDFKNSSLQLGSYEDFEKWSEVVGGKKFQGVLVDLGVSSLQLDEADRGFSFSKEAPLDMRMGFESEVTAADIVNTWSQKDLEILFRELGEETFPGRIARVIVESRRKRRIETTTELADIVRSAVPGGFRKGRIHPATRVFQALRIEVNQELERLKNFLKKAPQYLEVGGRLVVISYHSLEDRIVKQTIHNFEKEDVMRKMTKKPLIPTDEEIKENPRSRSAKMRISEKLGEKL
ncbi:MAG: 16S rRNA (cytosine(1402)-N(4))-methyltransferase RsmH [Deltaproteobacteria bacterium]|nr:MAG: 16S rRNA (cytosine(1402)-N(4))-methyltransferase RsmH [Deltaproteobacteria bacterium]